MAQALACAAKMLTTNKETDAIVNLEAIMQMWVFRITRGWGGGDPQGACPIGINHTAVTDQLKSITPNILSYDGSEIDFVIEELFKYGRLRQGWGIPGLDLNLPDSVWVENYRIGAWQYWEEHVTCNDAMGRRNILNHMKEMAQGDIIFIPNVSGKNIDPHYFAIAIVNSIYEFENRNNKPDGTWKKDFGHIIYVTNLKLFKFSNNNLPRSIFGPPFLHAIDPIRPHYNSYNLFEKFVSNHYMT